MFQKSVDRTHGWLSVVFGGNKWDKNRGQKTNEIYYADSMVSWLVMEQEEFVVDPAVQGYGKLAQVLYKNDGSSYLRVSDSTFTCENTYSKTIIQKYDWSGVQGRPGLFRISDPSADIVRLG